LIEFCLLDRPFFPILIYSKKHPNRNNLLRYSTSSKRIYSLNITHSMTHVYDSLWLTKKSRFESICDDLKLIFFDIFVFQFLTWSNWSRIFPRNKQQVISTRVHCETFYLQIVHFEISSRHISKKKTVTYRICKQLELECFKQLEEVGVWVDWLLWRKLN